MKVYKLTSWIEPEYGTSYEEKVEYFLAKNKQGVLKELEDRGIVLNERNTYKKYYGVCREEQVYKLEKVKVTKIEEYREPEEDDFDGWVP